MIKTMRNLLLACLIPAFVAGTVVANTATPTAQVREAVETILTLLRQELEKELRRAKIRAVVHNRFDFRGISRSVLATNWKKASPEEQDQFVELFSQLLENTYIVAIESYTDEKVTYPKERVKGKRAIVDTFIVTSTIQIPITYRMKQKNGEWFIYDVVIEGVSLVSNYRNSFNAIFRKKGMEGLLQELETKIQALKSKQDQQTG